MSTERMSIGPASMRPIAGDLCPCRYIRLNVSAAGLRARNPRGLKRTKKRGEGSKDLAEILSNSVYGVVWRDHDVARTGRVDDASAA